jgi:hypothetical protein
MCFFLGTTALLMAKRGPSHSGGFYWCITKRPHAAHSKRDPAAFQKNLFSEECNILSSILREGIMENLVQMDLPPRLHQQMRLLIKEGWFRDETDILLEALRRFL